MSFASVAKPVLELRSIPIALPSFAPFDQVTAVLSDLVKDVPEAMYAQYVLLVRTEDTARILAPPT